jgi:hydroxyacylglutathione hydrolase
MPDLLPIPAFEDNYIWTVHDDRFAVVVDPGEAEPILTWLADQRIQPAAVLVTHHHRDHVGGLEKLLARYPGTPIYGPAADRIAGVNHPVSEGDVCRIPELRLHFDVLAVPGHTPGHVVYVGHGWLFCGDTVFSCGCGKVFGSTVGLLHDSLKRIAALPSDTLICSAHEYTLENIRFALSIEPGNSDLIAWQARATELRSTGQPTLPTRLDQELSFNPFMRCHLPALQRRLAELTHRHALTNSASAFAAIRALRDEFTS